jgi:RNA polymerase sigma factor (sigma-70 family)
LKIFTLHRTSNEETLIQRCKKRDPKAQRALYEHYAGKMMAVCRRYIPTAEEAEEVLSNGFIKVFTSLDKYEFKGSFEGWIRKIMVRECLMHLRSRKAYVEYTDSMENHDRESDTAPDNDLDHSDLISLINDLPDGYRTVFNMYVIEGYKHQEIAVMLNITESTSKTQLLRARNLLQQRIKDMENAINELSNIKS